ncbi:hypothetical protein [Tumebacillus flagellatus]|uniref:Lipoprotein n=1 Tax=Tumebacillus flagellatus TaxID=1157490 RepID=A0A074LR86_9BACL|nr:hypothetical protein [Tumebacillus flagellatus]KEO82353.1 hypothetical protein EL26_15625 [Tumebacillus flagellatus]
MKKQLTLLLLAGALLGTAMTSVGCSNATDVSDKLQQSAQDALNKLQNDPELKNKLMTAANATKDKVESFMGNLMKNQTVVDAEKKLGDKVVQEVIEQAVQNNGGKLDAATQDWIVKELQKRMQQ